MLLPLRQHRPQLRHPRQFPFQACFGCETCLLLLLPCLLRPLLRVFRLPPLVFRPAPFLVALGQCQPRNPSMVRNTRKYRTRFVNEPLRIYHSEPDGITAAAAAAGRNAYSYALGNRIKLNEEIDYLRHAPGGFLRSAANYVRFSLHVRTKPGAIVASLHHVRSRLLCLAAFPLGWGIYARDLLRAR